MLMGKNAWAFIARLFPAELKSDLLCRLTSMENGGKGIEAVGQLT